jgi:hypothetical protein
VAGLFVLVVSPRSLAASDLPATARLAASSLEEMGHSHAESNWALRAATDLAPRRLTAFEAPAISRQLPREAGLIREQLETFPDDSLTVPEAEPDLTLP